MIFRNQRLFYTKGIKEGDYTIGFFNNDAGTFRAIMLEDTKQAEKISGITRIPAGFYELQIRKEDTPLTIKHRINYQTPWFKNNPGWYHIEITKIQGFKYVYIHAGNDDSHSDGCVLPAYSLDLTKRDNVTANSILACNDFYAIAYPLLQKGVRCFIEVRDEIIK